MLASMFLAQTEKMMDGDVEGKAQYNVFEDYLGLINLVCPSRCSAMRTRSCESLTSSMLFEFPQERSRINSLDSDGLSDISSSSGSRDLDTIYDSLSLNGDLLGYSTVPSPPLFGEPINSSYNSTLETILAVQKQARLHHVNNKENRQNKNKPTVCVFCRNNGESPEFYSTHTLKDSAGKTTCPILRRYTCPLCNANGDNSHTVKYCPKYTPKMKEEKQSLISLGL